MLLVHELRFPEEGVSPQTDSVDVCLAFTFCLEEMNPVVLTYAAGVVPYLLPCLLPNLLLGKMDNREIGWISEDASVVGQLLVKRGREMGRKDRETTSGKGNIISKH